jgi:hypothetical protein
LEDTYNLNAWEQRQVALGLVTRPDLQVAVAASWNDKTELNRLVRKAKDAAKTDSSANTGTALHKVCENYDTGQPLGPIQPWVKGALDIYASVTDHLDWLGVEQFVVLDELQVGGTYDRRFRLGGKTYIADIKTGGDLRFGHLKIAAQLAVYAHGVHYDPETFVRTPFQVEQDRALVIHLPAPQAENGHPECNLLWFDIAAGWEAVVTAASVRALRKRRDWIIKEGLA